VPFLNPVDPQYDAAIAHVRRRRTRARLALGLIFLTMWAAVWLANDQSPVWLFPGMLIVIGLQIVRILAYVQMCPRCHQSLVIEHSIVSRSLAKACPVCGLMID
jgi:hypothetical protein